MIEQTEEALLHEHPHIMKKTHKGEEEVEAEGEEDLSSLSASEVRNQSGWCSEQGGENYCYMNNPHHEDYT